MLHEEKQYTSVGLHLPPVKACSLHPFQLHLCHIQWEIASNSFFTEHTQFIHRIFSQVGQMNELMPYIVSDLNQVSADEGVCVAKLTPSNILASHELSLRFFCRALTWTTR